MTIDKHPYRPFLLGPWRRAFQWLMILTLFVLPWIQPGGISLIRIDIPSLSLHLFGEILRIEELYLFLLACLVLGIAFLLVTLVLGRVWCGWACPQTALSDLAEWLARRLGLNVVANRLVGNPTAKGVLQFGYLLIALLVSANLLWYFIEPQRFFRSLLSGTMHFGVLMTFLCVAVIVYLDLALIRRLMCREFCPYGRIQSSFVDSGTLTLRLPETEKSRCIKCNSCVRTCPMDIDIRQGYQIECINCGRCLDACRNIMAKRRQPGLIHYTFGVENRGIAALLNPRVITLGLVLLLLSGALTIAVFQRAEASLKISLAPVGTTGILADGRQSTLMKVWINNRTTDTELYQLTVAADAGDSIELKGQTSHIQVAGGGNHELSLIVLTPVRTEPAMVEFDLINSRRQPVARAKAVISPPPPR